MKQIYFLLFGILVMCTPNQEKKETNARATVQVITDKGTIEGMYDAKSGINLFLGIPYAKPPVGELRWKAPQPVDPWEGVLEAKKFGPRAVQENYWGDMVYRSNGMSEDCLYLNVWAPAGKKLQDLPVLVYIYGGGFVCGDASEPRYDGASMAAKGIVVVSMNYRLNIFGFFAHPELSAESPYKASGNYGLLDQQAAIRWVKDNIAAFGGDPNHITIAGESAGSISVSAQMASPLTKDMLAGAIGESGAAIQTTFSPVPLREAEKTGKELANAAGYNNLAELRALSSDELYKVYQESGRFGFPLVIDNYFLPASLPEIFEAGEQAQIPLLVGWNSEESSGAAFMKGLPYTPENYRKRIEERFPKNVEKALQLYPGTNEKEVELSATALASDEFIAFSTWKWYDLQLQNSSQPVYRYFYSKLRPPVNHEKQAELTGIPYNPDPNAPPQPKPLGAPHSAEIPYCLGNLPLLTEYPWTKEDYEVSETMQSYFSNFITTGDPNGEGLPEWPATRDSQDSHPVMHIDVKSYAVNSEVEERYHFLDQIYGTTTK